MQKTPHTLFGLPKVDVVRNPVVEIYLQQCSRTVQPTCSSLCSLFYRGQFPEPMRVQGGCAQKLLQKKKWAIPTLLGQTVFIFALESEADDYGKEGYISNTC